MRASSKECIETCLKCHRLFLPDVPGFTVIFVKSLMSAEVAVRVANNGFSFLVQPVFLLLISFCPAGRYSRLNVN